MPPKKKSWNELSASAKYYRKNAEARRKKAKKDSEINSRPEQKKKRRESGRKRYAAKKRGTSVEGKDFDHFVNSFVDSKTNRGRKNGTKGDRNARGSKNKRK